VTPGIGELRGTSSPGNLGGHSPPGVLAFGRPWTTEARVAHPLAVSSGSRRATVSCGDPRRATRARSSRGAWPQPAEARSHRRRSWRALRRCAQTGATIAMRPPARQAEVVFELVSTGAEGRHVPERSGTGRPDSSDRRCTTQRVRRAGDPERVGRLLKAHVRRAAAPGGCSGGRDRRGRQHASPPGGVRLCRRRSHHRTPEGGWGRSSSSERAWSIAAATGAAPRDDTRGQSVQRRGLIVAARCCVEHEERPSGRSPRVQAGNSRSRRHQEPNNDRRDRASVGARYGAAGQPQDQSRGGYGQASRSCTTMSGAPPMGVEPMRPQHVAGAAAARAMAAASRSSGAARWSD
jgi:hypothetical protein